MKERNKKDTNVEYLGFNIRFVTKFPISKIGKGSRPALSQSLHTIGGSVGGDFEGSGGIPT